MNRDRKTPRTAFTRAELVEIGLTKPPMAGTARAHFFLTHALMAYLAEYVPEGYDAETFKDFVGAWLEYAGHVPHRTTRRRK